jgi:hypothetical protein
VSSFLAQVLFVTILPHSFGCMQRGASQPTMPPVAPGMLCLCKWSLSSKHLALQQAQRRRHGDVSCACVLQGKMIAVLPFVGKILEATKDSKSYRPSNPWVSRPYFLTRN